MPGDGAADANDAAIRVSTDFATLQDTIMAWHKLRSRAGAERDHPRDCGPLHTAPEITAASMDF